MIGEKVLTWKVLRADKAFRCGHQKWNENDEKFAMKMFKTKWLKIDERDDEAEAKQESSAKLPSDFTNRENLQ